MRDLTPSAAQNLRVYEVKIANGASVSEEFSTEGGALVGILMPAAWTAANLAFNCGATPGSLGAAYDGSGSLMQATVAAAHYVAFPLPQSAFGPYMSLVSVNTDGGGAAVNQGADRLLLVFVRRFLS